MKEKYETIIRLMLKYEMNFADMVGMIQTIKPIFDDFLPENFYDEFDEVYLDIVRKENIPFRFD